jgi:hypothetical protein
MENKENIYGIAGKDKSIELVSELEEAVKSQDSDAVQKILSDPEALHALIVRIGEGGHNLKLVENGFDLFLQSRFGKEASLVMFDAKRGPELIDFLHETGLPEQVLNELSHAAFHRGEEAKFFNILQLIYLNQERFQNQQVVARAIHDMASWHGKRRERGLAADLNKEALGAAQKTGDNILEQKVRAGLSINKELLPKDRADDLIKYAEELKTKGVGYDAARLKVEAALALLDLSKRQRGSQKEESLGRAKEIALEDGLKAAVEIDYPNAEILAREILADIYKETGDARKEKSYRAGASARKRFVKGLDV